VATTAGPTRWTTTATALPDGTVLVVGGYDEGIRVHSDAHIIQTGP
jgi:Galactose oxidase, central domain